jgi:hypothetical protein
LVLSDRIEKEIQALPKGINLKPLESMKAEDKLAALAFIKAVLPVEEKPAPKQPGATIPAKSTGGEKNKNDVINNSAQFLAEFNAKKK